MGGFDRVVRASGWRTRAALVVVVVAAAGTIAGVAGATPTTSTTDVSFVNMTVPHKVLSNTVIGANVANSPVVIGGSTTVPTNATTVRLTVSAKGLKAGTLSFYPADNVAGGSGQTLAYPAGNTVVTTTIEENVGLNDKLTVLNTGAGGATVTATLTGYSTQVTAGDINGTGGAAGEVLTDNGAGGASWTDIGHAYSVATGFFVQSIPNNVTVTIASLTVPAGTYAVSLSGTFQSGSGRSYAFCRLVAPNGNTVQSTFNVADAADVNDEPISHQGVISTAGGGVITESCLGGAGVAQAGDVNMTALRVGAASGAVTNSAKQVAAPSGKGLPVR